VETVPERLDPQGEPGEVAKLDALAPGRTTPDDPVVGSDGTLARRRPVPPARARSRRRDRVGAGVRQEILWVGVVYLATRLLLLLAAFLLSRFGHHNFLHELANWDGLWYRELANHGYPNYPSHLQTTLGFFPLFSVGIWTLEPLFSVTGHNPIWASTVAGAFISLVGGFIATWLIYRLATSWWDKAAARRAVILFVLFPGSVVFSMLYSEGIMMPLAIGCIYALQRRRWLTAGLLAGFATAVQPVALVLIPVCAFSAVRELRRQGWRLRDAGAIFGPAGDEARPVLLAPALSFLGVGLFAFFLWLWTGTPFANYQAQHHGWGEKTNFFALVHLTTTLLHQISFSHLNEPTINLNLVVGLVGAFLLIGMLALMFRARRTIAPEAIVWTLGVSFLALTSQYVPPNPRMLITAFPALMVVAYYVRGKWFTWLAWGNGIALVGLSLLTFYGVTLRP
jgi:hypothetical protein